LYRGISDFKKGYQLRINKVKDEKCDLVTDCHVIVARWRNNFPQLLNVHGVNDGRQTETDTAEQLVPEPSAFEVELAIEKLKSHRSPVIKKVDVSVNCNWVDTRLQWYSTHLHTNSTQNNTINNKTTRIMSKTTQIRNLEECWPCPVFVSFTLAFALQLREKHGKTSVRVAEEIQRGRRRDSKILIDQTPADLIKAGGRTTLNEIHKLIISTWNKEKLPEE
jgi:hypothetical protein